MSDNVKTGILAVEDPFYIEQNIVPMNDRGIFRPYPLEDGINAFLKPLVKKERFDKYISFQFDYQKISGRIVYEKKDYSHLVSAFSVKFFPKEDEYDENDLQEVCRLLSLKLQGLIQVKISNKKLISFIKGVELKSKTPKKQDFTFHKLFEHAANTAQESLQKYMDDHFDFWFACGENEAAECNAVYGDAEPEY
ncbi:MULTISPECIES: hypothetical protein [unclassified Fibrobacter]|uniref:hypothetical protein n=1 Tax=unclassified Fibrobacter TaxID=2634177 RepID=UPI000D6A9EA3|nr:MULTISPECIES: hypothetical protein [unclassified Fibrobacter]PWJ70106.1 hypothetical protein BGX12_10371 [Fibrobacter sp. UWR4]PZW73454.1 hypothetical protein C8E88_100372 [Fibrobacter sp. UWR1]